MLSLQQNCLISACLLGLCTRYDGKTRPDTFDFSLTEGYHLIPVCPEQLGGLPTPRPAADIVGGDGHDVLQGKAKVLSREGDDFTNEFIKGAEQVLKIAKMFNCQSALLKARSPSCAVSGLPGVTAALLMKNSITVIEADYPKILSDPHNHENYYTGLVK